MSEEKATYSPYIELGSTGLNRFSGWVHEEWLRDLQGQRAIRIYKEMRDDHLIGSILFAIQMLIRQTTWRVDAAGTTNVDLEAAEFLEGCMGDMSQSWTHIINEILSMFVFGWSWHEIVYKRRNGDSRNPTQNSKYTDGRIAWRKIPIRAQETFWQWRFTDDGGVDALIQQPPPDYVLREIPIEKSLLFRTEANKNNPEGRSLLRTAYKAFYFRKNIEIIEGIGIERDLAGLPVANVPPELLLPSAPPDQKAVLAQIQNMVSKIRRDEMEGVVFPAEEYGDGKKTGYKLSLLTSGGRRNFDTNQIINRYDQRIAMTVLADFILLGHEKVGSFALASSKTEMFAMALGAFLDDIAEVFNTYAIPRLFALNSFQGLTGLPTLKHGDIETPDLTELGNYISALSGAGVPLFPDEQLENYVRQVANFPKKPKDLEQQGNTMKPETGTNLQDAKEFAKFITDVRRELDGYDQIGELDNYD